MARISKSVNRGASRKQIPISEEMDKQYQQYKVIRSWWETVLDIFIGLLFEGFTEEARRKFNHKSKLPFPDVFDDNDRLRLLLIDSPRLVNDVNVTLKNASVWLSRAESEYQQNAFAPFWDAVENAARDLDVVRTNIEVLARNAQWYSGNLHCYRRHTFPAFSVRLESIPDPTPVAEELRRVVRMGETNFQFATIWEHRRTREVLIAGFRTLGEGINNLGQAIQASMADLRDSISSGLASVVEGQIAVRKAIEKKKR